MKANTRSWKFTSTLVWTVLSIATQTYTYTSSCMADDDDANYEKRIQELKSKYERVDTSALTQKFKEDDLVRALNDFEFYESHVSDEHKAGLVPWSEECFDLFRKVPKTFHHGGGDNESYTSAERREEFIRLAAEREGACKVGEPILENIFKTVRVAVTEYGKQEQERLNKVAKERKKRDSPEGRKEAVFEAFYEELQSDNPYQYLTQYMDVIEEQYKKDPRYKDAKEKYQEKKFRNQKEALRVSICNAQAAIRDGQAQLRNKTYHGSDGYSGLRQTLATIQRNVEDRKLDYRKLTGKSFDQAQCKPSKEQQRDE